MEISKKTLYIMNVYTAIITFFLIYIFRNYYFFDIYFIDCFLSFYIIGYFTIYYCCERKFISIETIFNVFGLLYSDFYIVECIMNNKKITPQMGNAMMLAHLSIIAFNIAFCLTKSPCENEKESVLVKYNYVTVRRYLFLLFLLSLMVEAYVIFYKIGYNNFVSISRASKALLMERYSLLSFYKSTIPMAMAVFLFLYFQYKDRRSGVLFIISLSVAIFNAIMSASRAELISILLPLLFLLYYYEKISTRMVIALSILIFLFFGMWKSLFWGETTISFDSEFNSWYKIAENIFTDESNKKLWGKSYIKTLINLIIPVTNFESLSTWYVKKYEFSVYSIGGGRGFSGVIEAFINFGILGNIMIFSFYGWGAKKLKLKNDLHIVIYMILMISIYQIFRAESYSLWKNIMWFKIYPICIIFFMSRMTNLSTTDEIFD